MNCKKKKKTLYLSIKKTQDSLVVLAFVVIVVFLLCFAFLLIPIQMLNANSLGTL